MDRRQCRHLIGTRTRMRSAADALWRAGGLEKQVARHCFVHFAWSMTCPWSFIQPRPEPVGDLLCLPTLDRPRLEFFRLCHDGGLVRPSGKCSAPGILQSMAPWGRSSLQCLRRFYSFSTASAGIMNQGGVQTFDCSVEILMSPLGAGPACG